MMPMILYGVCLLLLLASLFIAEAILKKKRKKIAESASVPVGRWDKKVVATLASKQAGEGIPDSACEATQKKHWFALYCYEVDGEKFTHLELTNEEPADEIELYYEKYEPQTVYHAEEMKKRMSLRRNYWVFGTITFVWIFVTAALEAFLIG